MMLILVSSTSIIGHNCQLKDLASLTAEVPSRVCFMQLGPVKSKLLMDARLLEVILRMETQSTHPLLIP